MEEIVNINKQSYWSDRYSNQDTPWDIGDVSPPLKHIIDHLDNQDARLLFPGSGTSHDPFYAYSKGFKNTYACDWSESCKNSILKKYDTFPPDQYIIGDFFNLDSTYDVILEQTFFCALTPDLREKYVHKMHALLQNRGIITGVLFIGNRPGGPPFFSSKETIINLFSDHFVLNKLEPSTVSLPQRTENEYIFEFEKR